MKSTVDLKSLMIGLLLGISTCLVLAARDAKREDSVGSFQIGAGTTRQTGSRQSTVATLFLERGDYPDRIGHAVWEVFAKHQFADFIAEHEFATPWIVVRGSDASLWFVAERFHSTREFDRIYVHVTQDNHVTTRITPYHFGPSTWAILGTVFVDRRPEAEAIAEEIAERMNNNGETDR
jgi:hypothetical protein